MKLSLFFNPYEEYVLGWEKSAISYRKQLLASFFYIVLLNSSKNGQKCLLRDAFYFIKSVHDIVLYDPQCFEIHITNAWKIQVGIKWLWKWYPTVLNAFLVQISFKSIHRSSSLRASQLSRPTVKFPKSWSHFFARGVVSIYEGQQS